MDTDLETVNSTLSVGGGITVQGHFKVEAVAGVPALRSTTLSCSMQAVDGEIGTNATLLYGGAVTMTSEDIFIMDIGSQLTLPSSPGALFINKGIFTMHNQAVVSGSLFSNAPNANVVADTGDFAQFQGTLADSGTFNVNAGGSITILANTAFHNGAMFTGGPTLLSGGTHTLDGTVTIAGSFLMGSNGVPDLTLNGTLEVAAGGNFQWLGGGLTGNGTSVTGSIQIDTNGLMTVNNLNGLTLRNTVLTNGGTVNWVDSGQWFVGFDAQIINAGSFTVLGDGGLNPINNGNPAAAVATFNNAKGTFTKQQGSTNSGAATSIAIYFDDGNVIVQQGILKFSAGGSIDNWRVGSNGAVQLNGGTFGLKLDPDMVGLGGRAGTISGLADNNFGPVIVNSSSVILDLALGTLTVNGGELIQSGGVVGDGELSIFGEGLFVWNSGTLEETTMNIGFGSVMDISGGGSIKSLGEFTSIRNEGTVNWTNANSAGVINAADGASVDNRSRFNIGCDSHFNDVSTNAATRPIMTNGINGVLTKFGTSGTSSIGIKLVDLGLIVAETGNLELGPYDDSELARLGTRPGGRQNHVR